LYIQLTKKLSQKAADRLRAARKTITALSAFADFKYLFEAANAEQSPPELQTKDCNFNTVNVIKGTKLGPYVPSEYRVGTDNAIVDCTRVNHARGASFPDGLIFSLQLLNTSNFSFSYRDFLLEISGSELFTEELFLSGASSLDEGHTKLKAFINYFRDKPALYQKVYRLLVAQRKTIVTAFGKEFATSIIDLFSLKTVAEELEDFTFFKKRYAKQFYEELAFPLKESKDLYLSKFYVPQEFVANVAHLYLSEDNLLKVYFSLENGFLGWYRERKHAKPSYNLETALRKAPAFDTFLKENLNGWLKSIISMANFEEKLCNKIKTKILISQI